MFINLYTNASFNYDNNVHLIFTSEADFLSYMSTRLISHIDSEAAQNFVPNGKDFTIDVSLIGNPAAINYIIWYTGNAYKHYRVINFDIYSTYYIYHCESDIWADATYNGAFLSNTKMRLTRCNKTFTISNTTIPAYYDGVNYTNGNFTETPIIVQLPTGFSAGYGVYIAIDKAVDTWSLENIVYGTTYASMVCAISNHFNTLNEIASKISGIYQDSNGNKIRVKACYILPFVPSSFPTPDSPNSITFSYKTAGSTGTLTGVQMRSQVLTFNTTINNYDYGNNKIYVGAGYSNMEILNVYPRANITYRIVITNYDITAYVEQGDNTKDISSAYILKITSNDAMLTSQESLAKLTGAGFKAVSGALMLTSPATAVGGAASIAGAGIDLITNKKAASYTMDGDAVSTYEDSHPFNYRIYKAINDLKHLSCLYGLNYNVYMWLNEIINYGTLLDSSYQTYIKGEVIKMYNLNVEQYNFVKGELERGIYVLAPAVNNE